MFWKRKNRNRIKKLIRKTGVSKSYEIRAFLKTDRGLRRPGNEDSIKFVHPNSNSHILHKGYLAILADGMGGHQAGEIASSMAVDIIAKAYYNHSTKPKISLKHALNLANKEIYESAQTNSQRKGMGTTCTALVLLHGKALFAQVGDSRLYLCRDKKLRQLSEDQTLVRDMVKRGLISEKEAINHESKNIITQALGTKPLVQIDGLDETLETRYGDLFILSSDGLTDLVTDEEINATINQKPVTQLPEELINLAKSRGGYDNISVITIQVLDPNERERDQITRNIKAVK